MGTVEQLTQLAFNANQAKHLAINGLDVRYGDWIPATSISSANEIIDVSNAFVYATAGTMKVAGDMTSLVQHYDKMKWTQSGATRYGYLSLANYAAGETTLSIVGNSDYSIGNSAITDFCISRADMPLGFPKAFNYNGGYIFTGFSVEPPDTITQFFIKNGHMHIDIRMPTQGTSNATNFTLTPLPVTATTLTNGVWGVICYQAFDNGAEISPPARAYITSGQSKVTFDKTTASGLWTNANGKMASFTNLVYPI